MNLVLITTGIIFLAGIIMGIRRGAVRIAVSLVTTLLTLIIVVLVTPYTTEAITKYTPLDEMIRDKVSTAMTNAAIGQMEGNEGGDGASFTGLTEETVTKALQAAGISEENLDTYGISVEEIVNGDISSEELSKYGVSEELLRGLSEKSGGEDSGALQEAIENADIPEEMQEEAINAADIPDIFKKLLKANNNEGSYKELGVQTFAQYVGSFLSKLVIHLVAFVVTFLIVTIILRAVVFALDIIAELPLLGLLNRLAGGLVGAVGSLIVVWLLFIVVTLLYTTTIGRDLYDSIQGNAMLKVLYDCNPVMVLATKYM